MNRPLRFFCLFFLRYSPRVLSILLLSGVSTQAREIRTNSVPAALSISVSSPTVCAGTSTTLTVSGCDVSGTIRWSTSQTGNSLVVAPVQNTVYTATCSVTTTANSNPTVTTAAATVQVNPPIAVITQLTPVSCSGRSDGQIVVGATGGTGLLQYQFNGQPFQTSNSLGSLKAGTYPVVVKDAAGCLSQVNAVIKEPLPLTATVTAVAAKCIGGSDGGLIALASGGAGDYRYLLNDGTPQVSGTFFDLKANTTYALLVSDKQGCLFRQSVPIGAPTPFSIKLTGMATRCMASSDGSVRVSVDGGKSPYQYRMGTGALQTGILFTGLAANTYEVTVQDANGCEGKASVAVEQPAPLKLTSVVRPVNCFGPASGAIILTPTGGTGRVMYQLTSAQLPQTSNVITGVGAGEYTVIGTDANGCTGVTSVTVGKADPLTVQATTTPASCCVCPTGSVQLVSMGGTGTRRQFQLTGQAFQPTGQISGLRPNTYRLRVMDEAGCIDSVAVVITDASAMTLSPATVKGVSCAGGKDGEAAVQVVGGTKPFTYHWMTENRDTINARTATQTGLAEGTYTVSVVDSNFCTTATTFVSLKAQNPLPFKPTISQSGGQLLAENQTTGLQWYVRTGNDPGKAVANATQPVLVPFVSGQYYVVVTANGCESPPSEAIDFILTALAEPTAGLSVRIIPNPISDHLRVEIEQSDRAVVLIGLLDASGRLVRQYQIPAFTGKRTAEWPLPGILPGVYLLKATAGEKQVVSRVEVE